MKVLFLTLLLVSAFALQEDDGMDIIHKLESSESGKRMLETIAIQMESGDPADDLVRMLQGEEDRLDAEQDIDDDYILNLQNVCVDDLATLVDEIASTRQRIQELEDLLTSLRPILAAKENEKADLEDFAALIEEKLQQMEIAKRQKDEEWAAEAAEHDNLTSIIQQAKNIIQNAMSASFLQTTANAQQQVLAQVSQHFNQAKKTHFKRKSINSIFRVLAQLTGPGVQANQGVIDRIIAIADDLLDKIAESRAIEKNDYDHWMKEYNNTKTQLTTKLDETNARIAQLTTDIAILKKRISMSESELEDQEQRLEQKIVQHDDREYVCDSAGKKYAKDREERSDEKEIISDAIGLLVSKIRMLKKYVSDSVSTLKRPVL